MNGDGSIIWGVCLVILCGACMAVLAMRLAEAAGDRPRDHLLVASAAVLFAGLAARMVDVAQHLDVVRWSAPVGALALLLFLTHDYRAHRKPYTGPDRRRTVADRD